MIRRSLTMIAAVLIAGCHPCENRVAREIASPDGAWKAVVFDRSCGATTGFSTHVSIIRQDKGLGGGAGNALIVDTDHGKAPAADWGGPNIDIRWASHDTLKITHHPDARIFKQEGTVAGISIEYHAEAPVLDSVG